MKKISQEELNNLISNHNLYLESINDTDRKGKKLILDEIDFTSNDLSRLNFVEVYITSSLFKNITFENINFGGSELYSCHFENVIFKSVNFGKAILDYVEIKHSKFYNSELIVTNTNEAVFENVIFENCELNDVFSHAKVKNVEFINSQFKGIDFWKCVVENLAFKNMRNFNIKNLVKELNIGNSEKDTFISGEDAVNFFEKSSTIIRTK